MLIDIHTKASHCIQIGKFKQVLLCCQEGAQRTLVARWLEVFPRASFEHMSTSTCFNYHLKLHTWFFVVSMIKLFYF